MTIFKANLAACLVFALAIFALGSVSQRSLPRFTLDDLATVAVCTSPAWLWAVGAWVTRGRRRLALAWLATSVVLMTLAIGVCAIDAWSMLQEPVGEQTQHMGMFFETTFQWALGIVLLAVVALVRIVTRSHARKASMN
jgi:ABC-type branched-subunit amino acid transport system permease subunit